MPTDLFRSVLAAAFRRRALVLAGAGLTALGALALLTRVRFDSNVLHLLPQRAPAVRAFQNYLDTFGTFDRLYVMFDAPAGRDIGEYAEAVERYVDELRELPEIASVDSGRDDAGKDWRYLLDRELLLLGPARLGEAIARLQPSGLDAALVEARARLALPSADVKTLVQQDPANLLGLLRQRLGAGGLTLPLNPGEPGYISTDGRSRLVMAVPRRPPYDTAFARALNAKLDALAAEVAAAEPDPQARLTVKEAGGYRAAAESEAVIEREAIVNSVTSLLGIVVLVVLVFRSARPLVAVFAPILLAALVTVALVGSWQPLSTAAAGSAAMLFGLGVDGTLILYIIYLQERRAGRSPATAVANLGPVAASVALGFTTTAATFLGLIPVDLPALVTLGTIVGIGVLVCCAAAVVIVPALAPRGAGSAAIPGLRAAWLARFVARRRTGILVAAGAASIVLLPAARHLRLGLSVQALEPRIPAVETEKEIVQRFHLPDDALLALATAPALDAALDVQQEFLDALTSDGTAADIVSPAMLLPPDRVQKAGQARIAAAGLTAGGVTAALEQEADRAGFQPGSFTPFLDRLPALLDPDNRLTPEGYHTHGLDALMSRFVSERDGQVATVAYVYPRSPDVLPAIQAAASRAGASLQLTGLTLVNDELSQRFRPEFFKGAIIGVAGVLVLVVIGFRGVRAALLSLVPTALGVGWSAGALALSGFELDLFSVFALLMSVGIGVDYGVHLLHRRASRPEGGMSGAVADTGSAILLAGATTMIGFGSLATSSYAPLRALGLVTALTVACCLIASLLVLPALLARKP